MSVNEKRMPHKKDPMEMTYLKDEYKNMDFPDAFRICEKFFAPRIPFGRIDENSDRNFIELSIDFICYNCDYYIKFQRDINKWVMWSHPTNWLVHGETMNDVVAMGIRYIAQQLDSGYTRKYLISPKVIFDKNVRFLQNHFGCRLDLDLNALLLHDLNNYPQTWEICTYIIFDHLGYSFTNDEENEDVVLADSDGKCLLSGLAGCTTKEMIEKSINFLADKYEFLASKQIH